MLTKVLTKANRWWQLGGWIWLSLSLFGIFFLGIAVQRFSSEWLDIPAAMEATLLVVAIGSFISGCLKLEARQSSKP